MSTRAVCILLAGRGGRMGTSSDWIHKSLLPIGGRAILSRIISEFPKDFKFVFAVHHLQQQIRDYVAVAHPNLDVKFVQVGHISGPQSGPGYSLLCCESDLQEPFYLVCGDTLWMEDIVAETSAADWIAVPNDPVPCDARFCNLLVNDEFVVEIRDKKTVSGSGWKPFVGLGHVWSYKNFFAELSRNHETIGGERQLSAGFQALIKSGLKTRKVTWIDTGTTESYLYAQKLFGENHFAKVGETIYFENNHVIKFFADTEVARRRISRSENHQPFFPQIQNHRGSFFSYKYLNGRTLAQTSDLGEWQKFFNFLDNAFWTNYTQTAKDFAQRCRLFYVDKTIARIQNFLNDTNLSREELRVNGFPILRLLPTVEKVAMELAHSGGIPSRIHGDLQPENVIVTDKGFSLIDWRQDFGGDLECGDLYWDLAKFSLWFDIQYEKLISENIDVGVDGCNILFSWDIPSHPARKLFDKFVLNKKFDIERIEKLKSLALLNMAGIHAGPLSLLFFGLGVRLLMQSALRSRDVA